MRKAGRPPGDARAAILAWQDAYPLVPTSPVVMARAVDLAADHRLSIWDAVILSSAADAGCRLLLSEDLQEGFAQRPAGRPATLTPACPRSPRLPALTPLTRASPVLTCAYLR